MIVHPWHGIEPGARAPEVIDCVIEVPRGSRNKYELDKKTGLLRLDRVLYSAVFYPANYGFIPRTYCDDRDPLDILVLGQESVVPMCIMTARPIGVMQMIDQDEEDDKIIAIHEHDPAFAHFRDINELPRHTLDELKNFFEDYKKLEHKKVRIERFKNCEAAQKIVLTSLELYNQSYDSEGLKRHDAPILASEEKREAQHLLAQKAAQRVLDVEADEALEQTSRTPSRSVRADAARRAAARNEAGDIHEETPRINAPETDETLSSTRSNSANVFPLDTLDSSTL